MKEYKEICAQKLVILQGLDQLVLIPWSISLSILKVILSLDGIQDRYNCLWILLCN